MPIAINGSGTITGISVGGLENGCVNEADLANAAVTETKLASNAVTIDKLGTTLQSQVCKAWVNFNGTSTVTIRASYNVSSITDNGTGDYTVNFTTALADANYAVCISASIQGTTTTNGGYIAALSRNATPATGSVRFETSTTVALADTLNANVAIFR